MIVIRVHPTLVGSGSKDQYPLISDHHPLKSKYIYVNEWKSKIAMFDSISLFLVHSQPPDTVKNKVCFNGYFNIKNVYGTPRSVSETLYFFYSKEWQSQTMTAF